MPAYSPSPARGSDSRRTVAGKGLVDSSAYGRGKGSKGLGLGKGIATKRMR